MTQPQDAPTAGKRKTQQERKADSEQGIIRAAIRIIAKQGFLRTTLNEVGEEAGYTGGLVSHRFGSKNGLLTAVINRIRTRFAQDQIGESTSVEDAEEAIRRYIEIYMKEVTVRESHMRALYVIMGEALGGDAEVQAEIADLNRSFRSQLARIVQRGVDNGQFRAGTDPDAAAVLIMGMLRGVVMQYLFDRKAYDTRNIIPMLQGAALDGLREEKS